MAKTVRVTQEGVKALETLKGQSKELLQYIVNKYGADKEINQSELVLDLNTHQKDTVVLSKESSSPISRLYEFYRSKTWAKAGWVVVTSESKGTGGKERATAKWKQLEERLKKLLAYTNTLEDLLEKHSITYEPLVMEEEEVETPEDVEEDETAEQAL